MCTLFILLEIFFIIMLVFHVISMMTAVSLAKETFADPEYKTHSTSTYPTGALYALWREYWTVSFFYLLWPLGLWGNDNDYNYNKKDDLPPVLFIHGWTETRRNWRWIIKHLSLFITNRHFYTINLKPIDATLETYAPQIKAKIEEILDNSKQDKVVLVGHSMGGVLARDYVRTNGAEDVETIITLGSPHKGTTLGFLALGTAVKQMLPNCEYLNELAKDENIKQVDVHCIASVHDNLVVPFHNAWLDHSTNYMVTHYGHVSMMKAPHTFSILREILQQEKAVTADENTVEQV